METKESATGKIKKLKQRIEEQQEKLQAVEKGRKAYSKAQQDVSVAVHSFSAQDNQPQTSEQAEMLLKEQAQGFEEIAEEQGVKDKKNAIGKFRRQIKDAVSIIDAWRLWTKESLSEYKLGKETKYWLLYVFLPVLYWWHQLQKTQHPEMRKVYESAWQNAQAAYETHPLTRTMSEKDIDRWRSWGEWASSNFCRASSAVEGRNGYLSQSHHNGRGLTNRRLRALTAIHNYGIKRRDGSTSAQRLYGERFPDMFEWLAGQMGALPLPRKTRKRVVPNPLIPKAVAA